MVAEAAAERGRKRCSAAARRALVRPGQSTWRGRVRSRLDQLIWNWIEETLTVSHVSCGVSRLSSLEVERGSED